MKRDSNLHPRGLTWDDVKDSAPIDESPSNDEQILDLDSSVHFPDGYKVDISENDPLSFYKFIIENKGKFGSQDQIDAYLNNYLQLLLRQQDWQRQSPAVQLQRLMATGMSRTAAMQMLSSAGSGVGGSSLTPQLAGNVEQSGSEKINAINGSVQAASALLQSIGQLFAIGSQMGLNKSTIALQSQQALLLSQQSQALSINNEMTRAQYDALGDAATAMQVLSNYKHKNPDYNIPDNINDWLSHCEKTPDAFLQYWSKQHMDKLKNPYYYAALKKSYEDYVKGNFDLETFKRQQLAQARLSELGIDGVVAEISNINQNTANAQETWSLLKENIRSAKASADYQEVVNSVLFTPDEDFDGKSAFAASVKGNSYMTYCAGLLAAMDYNIQHDYKYPILAQDALLEFQSWQSMTQEELLKRRDMYISKRENQELAVWLTAQYLSNLESGRDSFPGISSIMDFFKSYNMLVPMLQSAAGVYNTGSVVGGMVGSSAIGAYGNVQAAKEAGTGVQTMKDAAFIKTVVKGFK